MISVLQQARQPAPPEAPAPHEASAPREALGEQGEFEIVMSRGQLASTMLLALVLLVVFSAGAYMIGKSASPRPVVQAPVVAAPAAPAALTPAALTPAPGAPPVGTQAAPEKPVEAATPLSADLSAPLYAEQQAGKVYLQVGAVDRGLAGIWAEGLRTHGLNGFVAPGPSDKVWRVVIGPLPTPEEFRRAKDELDKLGISTFGRLHE